MAEEGEKLEVEDKSEDTSEIIWNQIEVVLGKSFWSVEPDEKADRYLFVKEEKTVHNVVIQGKLSEKESLNKEDKVPQRSGGNSGRIYNSANKAYKSCRQSLMINY